LERGYKRPHTYDIKFNGEGKNEYKHGIT
jgi:hypothetical protein